MTLTYDLKPCRFCSGSGVPVTQSGTKGATPFTRSRFFRGYIKCRECGFTSPVKNNPNAMVASWNKASDTDKQP